MRSCVHPVSLWETILCTITFAHFSITNKECPVLNSFKLEELFLHSQRNHSSNFYHTYLQFRISLICSASTFSAWISSQQDLKEFNNILVDADHLCESKLKKTHWKICSSLYVFPSFFTDKDFPIRQGHQLQQHIFKQFSTSHNRF